MAQAWKHHSHTPSLLTISHAVTAACTSHPTESPNNGANYLMPMLKTGTHPEIRPQPQNDHRPQMTHMSHAGMQTYKHTAGTEDLTSTCAHTDTHSQACTHTFVHTQICTPEHKESHTHSFGKILSICNVIPARLHQDTHYTNAGSKTLSWGDPWCWTCPRQIKNFISCSWKQNW